MSLEEHRGRARYSSGIEEELDMTDRELVKRALGEASECPECGEVTPNGANYCPACDLEFGV